MRNLRNCVPDPNSIISEPGSRSKVVYRSTFNGSSLVLSPDHVIDIQDSINAMAPYCDISYMLSRLSYGDSSVFSKSSPFYGDFTGMPKDPAGILSLLHDCEHRFDLLSAEERAEHGNDWRSYFLHFCGSSGSSSVSSGDSVLPSESDS